VTRTVGGPWPKLSPSDVHVWHLSAALPCRGVLSSGERRGAARIASAEGRALYRLAHAGLRYVLAGYIGCDPGSLQFRRCPLGKPILVGGGGRRPLQFNLSHSGDRVAVAVARHRCVGVDIERMRPLPRRIALADRFFSAEEKAALHASDPDRTPQLFYRLWSSKEAMIKATGHGLAIPLDSFAMDPEAVPPRVLRPPPQCGKGHWTLAVADILATHSCAVVAAGCNARVSHLTLERHGAWRQVTSQAGLD
jgi:4'-phosphopantetheinyl transferase